MRNKINRKACNEILFYCRFIHPFYLLNQKTHTHLTLKELKLLISLVSNKQPLNLGNFSISHRILLN